MATLNPHLVATAGEHYVCSQLAIHRAIPALVRQGAPSIDILASTIDGGRTVGIQVKTTEWALRTRGRGAEKRPYELQFPLGHHAIEQTDDGSIFCFVDLRIHDRDVVPDVYIVTAKALKAEYRGVNIRQYSFFRHHRPVAHMEPFKNCWDPILKALKLPLRDDTAR